VRSLASALVTGGAGFVGTWLVRALRAHGVKTIVVDPSASSNVKADVVVSEPVQGAQIGALVEEHSIDALFHLAGTGFVPTSIAHPLDDLARNTQTTVEVLEELRTSHRKPVFVLMSSAAVYGEAVTQSIDETHRLEPLSPYGVSKLAAEQYTRLYAGLHELETIVVRAFSLYGPGQRKLVVYDLLSRVLGGEDPLVVAAPSDVARDFVYIEDAADALVVLARNAPGRGEAYNLATGTPVSLRELAELIVTATGSGASVEFRGDTRPGDPRRWAGDAARARAIGARFETPLQTGLAATAEWIARER
jgi:UDP-glucose 4-epimerase